MKKSVLASSILAIVASGFVSAEGADYYSAWSKSDDDKVIVRDSFNDEYKTTVNEDNDVTKTYQQSDDDKLVVRDSLNSDYQSTVNEDNDITKTYTKTEDNDYSSYYRTSEDNDITKTYTHTEDNDVTSSWDYDSTAINPELTSVKKQDQHAGHQASNDVYGSASGHTQLVKGGPTVVSVGAEDTYNAGPVITNNNNFAPNMATVYGSNAAPIMQSGSFVGGDVKHYTVGPVGNTSANAFGNVGNQSGASVDQAGDSANASDDDMISQIGQ